MTKFKNFFKQIWLFIASLWNSLDALIEKYAPVAIKVVNEIKKINESTTGDVLETIITAVIPGQADNAFVAVLRAKLKDILPKVLTALNMSEAIARIEDPNEQLKAILTSINMSPDETKNAYYHSLSAMILKALSDGKLTWSESVQVAEFYYTNIYKKK